MKKIIYPLFVVAFAILSGCQDDVIEEPIEPVQTGDEIIFGSSLRNAETKTIYDDTPTVGEDGTSYYQVSWEDDGSDQIAIYCPQAADTKLAHYSVTPDESDKTTSSLVTKINVNEVLHWGAAEAHHFYGFYPSGAVTGTEDGKIKGTIPVSQNPTGWNEITNTAGGTTFYGTANTDYAYMWAYGTANKSETSNDVALTFHPWVTILEIEIPGPEQGTMKISNINVRATEGSETILTGDFICDMTAVENDPTAAPTYSASGSTSEVRNTISISGWNESKNDFIELGPNDKMVVRAFLLPVDENVESQTLEVRVSPVNTRVLTRTLGHTEASTTQEVAAHKVNKVILPRLKNNGYNYWMSSLDPDIYVSELSLPGSWNSLLTGYRTISGETGSEIEGNNARIVYQSTDIRGQFNAGVRAFHVQTGARYTTDNYGYVNPIEFTGGDLYVAVDGRRTRTNFTEILEELSNCLQQAEDEGYNQEYVFVQITYEGGAVEHDNWDAGELSTQEAWIRTVQQKLGEYSQEYNRIYTSEITPNTTISTLGGHIVLKVNTNDDTMDGIVDANAQLPSLFSRWYGAYLDNGTDLRWGSPNHSNTASLIWFYQEAGNIHRSGSYGPTDSGGNVSYEEKKQYAENVFDKSVRLYQSDDEHKYWYMNCLGGTYMDGSTQNVRSFTQDISDWAQEQLQLRTSNASLGLVYMNYADNLATSGQTYGSANLIQTIIDNNFKFQLRKAGSSY